MIEESKIIELLKSYEDGRSMRLEAMSTSQAREEEHISNMDKKLEAIDGKLGNFGSRIRILEDWKLVFVAKYSTYSAIALFFGSLIAQLLIHYIGKFI